MLEGICKPDYSNQNFSPLSKGGLSHINNYNLKLCNGNRPIIKMGLAHAFEQYAQVISILAIKCMLIMKTEKHPVATQICITQDISLLYINI